MGSDAYRAAGLDSRTSPSALPLALLVAFAVRALTFALAFIKWALPFAFALVLRALLALRATFLGGLLFRCILCGTCGGAL